MRHHYLLLLLWVAFAPLIASAGNYTLNVKDETSFLSALGQQESLSNSHKIGDRNLQHKAYGLLQIRLPYLRDVNRIAGKDVMRVWHKTKLTMADMKDPRKARWAAKVYLSYWGRYYTRQTGKLPTEQTYARIHNGGGVRGWRAAETKAYWQAVRSLLVDNDYYATTNRQID